jgi:hypothetical protein
MEYATNGMIIILRNQAEKEHDDHLVSVCDSALRGNDLSRVICQHVIADIARGARA